MKKINKNNFKKTLSKFATGITVVAINNKSTFHIIGLFSDERIFFHLFIS